jgi:hypothetical protein
MNKSNNTTMAGIAQFLVVLGTQGINFFDGDDATTLDIKVIVLSAIALFALVKAKDSGVTGTK